MIYYGVVEKIKKKHKSGIYGRRSLKNSEKLRINYSEIAITIGISVVFRILTFVLLGYRVYRYLIGEQRIELQHENTSKDKKTIIIPNELLEDNYNVSSSAEVLYGLFDNFTSKDKVFELLMKSKGGANLVIVEQSNITHNHFGGENGRFSCGLYVAHPKDCKILIPLDNSNELIKTFILEETIRAFEALGAKKIIIEDKTSIDTSINGNDSRAQAKLNTKYEKQILREKVFGIGTFDTERALKESLFIHDFPNIMTTIKARIDGNQIIEKFTETINLSAGLDVSVLALFSGNANFNYKRTWYFEVEFYDKNIDDKNC